MEAPFPLHLAFPRRAWLAQRPMKPSVQSSTRCGTPSSNFAVGFDNEYLSLTASSQTHTGPFWSDYYPQVSQNSPNALAPFFYRGEGDDTLTYAGVPTLQAGKCF